MIVMSSCCFAPAANWSAEARSSAIISGTVSFCSVRTHATRRSSPHSERALRAFSPMEHQVDAIDDFADAAGQGNREEQSQCEIQHAPTRQHGRIVIQLLLDVDVGAGIQEFQALLVHRFLYFLGNLHGAELRTAHAAE